MLASVAERRFLERMPAAPADARIPSDPFPKYPEFASAAATPRADPVALPMRQPLRVQERFWSLFRDAELGVALLDPAGQVRVGNRAFCDLLGYSADELAGMLLTDLSHPMDRKRDGRTVAEVEEGEVGSVTTETRLLCKSGALVWVKLCFHRVRAEADEPDGIVVIVEDLSSGWEAAEALHRLSTTDELTGLLNRRGFHLLAEQQWRIARRKNRELVLLYLDVDGLKQVNDRFGHAAGDDLLRETADILRHLCRDTDVVARLGGDEFVILAVEAMEESVAIFRERIQRVLRERNRHPGRVYELSLSLGAAHFGPDEQLSLEELLREADNRMYARKQDSQRIGLDLAPSTHPTTPSAAPAPPPAPVPAPLAAASREQRLTAALQEIVDLALGEGAHAERIARMHRRAVAALTGGEHLV
jgi:diguanylate cyclase (GGDEF)-like protein/PAS domain S-box-containing protein